MPLIVFDVDETLGAFGAFSEFCNRVSPYRVNYALFSHLLDLHPQFLRPGILDILSVVKHNKMLRKCGVVLYTNNQGPNEWVDMIRTYIEQKLRYPLFDQVIRAYKVNGVQVEPKRTQHDKSLKDLLACTKAPKKTEVFFVDDQFHPAMVQQNVHYFHIRPYEGPTRDTKFDAEPTGYLLQHLVDFLNTK
jgi:hypothetical protein